MYNLKVMFTFYPSFRGVKSFYAYKIEILLKNIQIFFQIKLIRPSIKFRPSFENRTNSLK